MKNDIVKLGVTLCLFTFITALLLSVVNGITAPVIEAATIEKTNQAIAAIFPDATDIEQADITGLNATVSAVYLAKSGEDTLGAAVKVAPNGFGGPISMIVGVNSDGTVASAQILSMSETAGLGTKTNTPEFLGQYEGKEAPFYVRGSGTTQITAISGATISSKAVTAGINTAVEAAQAVLSAK